MTNDDTKAIERKKLLMDAYKEVCATYHRIDDFRAKLLGFLPVASGAGIFLLLKQDTVPTHLTPAGYFGAVATLGLFF